MGQPGTTLSALLRAALAATVLWQVGRWTLVELRSMRANAARYAEARIEWGFGGLPIDAIAVGLDQRLAPATPVALGQSFPGLGRDHAGFLWQRLTEGLFPRRIVSQAAHVLEIIPAGAQDHAAVLGRLPDGASIVLEGPPQPVPGTAGRTKLDLDPLGVAWKAFGLFGLGGALLLALRAPVATRLERVLESLLAGSVLVSLLAHASVWLDVVVPWSALVGVGLVLGLLAIPRRGPAAARRTPLAILLFVVLGVFAARTLSLPVSGWDGRSIWLFRAKQLFFEDRPRTAVLATPELQPSYPLFLPAHLRFFAANGADFNERSAAASLGVLLLALVGLVWRSAARAVGASGAALVALALFAGAAPWSAEAYADGFLSLLLALQFLSAANGGPRHLTFLSAMAAGLLKREGLFLALLVGLAGGERRRGLGWCLVALTPAALHMGWVAWHRLPHDFGELHVPGSAADLGERLLAILRYGARGVLLDAFLALGFVAALFVLAGLLTRRIGARSMAARAFAAAGLTLAFSVAAFLFSPQPLAWHLDTAFPRLLLHPAGFAVVALALCLFPTQASSSPQGP